MPDLIQVANDLKGMPDQWLAQQMQSPNGSVPPWLVASEVERRQKLRSGAAQAQAPSSSVSQDLLRSLYAKIPPTAGLMPGGQPGNAPTPPGMPPVNLTPGGGSGALGSPPPGTPPANLRMPARTMAYGGSVDDEEEDPLQPSYEEEIANLSPPEEATPATGSASREAITPLDESLMKIVQAASQKYSIAPEVIQAQIHSESRGQKKAVSPKGARGLMQIMPTTAAELGITDPNQLDDPAINIDTGTHYLRKMLDKYGDLPTALKAYNAGPGAVDKYHGDPPFRETQGYVAQTMSTINGIRKSLNLPPLDQVPADIQSRLLKPTPPAPASNSPTPYADQVPGGVAMLPAQQAAPPAQVPADAVDPAAAPAPAPDGTADASGAPAAAAPPIVVAKKPSLQQTWEQPEPHEITELRQQVADFQKNRKPLDERLRDLYGEDNLKLLNASATALVGPHGDYTKYQQAIDNVMQAAQKNMHPSIGQALMNFGLALMANKSHNFGVAVGEAGSYAMQSMQALKQQGTKDYLEAARAGVALQDKMDEYNAKLGQYKLQRLGAQQTGVIQDERTFQTQLAGLQKQVVGAQNAFDKATTTPAAQQSAALAILNREGIPLDSKINNPMKQLVATGNTAWVQEAMTMGKGTGGATGPTTTEKTQEARAVQQLATHNGETWDPNTNPQDAQYKSAMDKLGKKYPAEAGMPTVSASVMQPTEMARARTIAQAIANGDQDPSLTGMYRLSPMVREILEKEFHYDLTRARLEYGATQKFLSSANNAAAINYQRSLAFANNQTGILQDAYAKWKQALDATGAPRDLQRFRGYNKAALEASMQAGGDVGAAAQRLASAVIEMQSILPGVYSGGYAPHTEDLQKAEKMLAANWDEKSFTGGLGLIHDLTQARQNAMKLSMPMFVRPDSPYLKNMPGAQGGGTGQQYRKQMTKDGVTIGIGSDNKWHNVATGELIQ